MRGFRCRGRHSRCCRSLRDVGHTVCGVNNNRGDRRNSLRDRRSRSSTTLQLCEALLPSQLSRIVSSPVPRRQLPCARFDLELDDLDLRIWLRWSRCSWHRRGHRHSRGGWADVCVGAVGACECICIDRCSLLASLRRSCVRCAGRCRFGNLGLVAAGAAMSSWSTSTSPDFLLRARVSAEIYRFAYLSSLDDVVDMVIIFKIALRARVGACAAAMSAAAAAICTCMQLSRFATRALLISGVRS